MVVVVIRWSGDGDDGDDGDGDEDIKNNAWVTVNDDFWVTSEAICQRFSRVTKSRVKIIGKSHHEWPQNCYSR